MPKTKNYLTYPVSPQEKSLLLQYEKFGDVNSSLHLAKNNEYETDNFNIELLQLAIQEIQRHNANLRCTYHKSKNGSYYKRIYSPGTYSDFTFKHIDMRDASKETVAKKVNKLLAKKYKIDDYPQVRFFVIQSSNNKFHLVSTITHLIADGFSAGIIFYQLMTYYNLLSFLRPLQNLTQRFIAYPWAYKIGIKLLANTVMPGSYFKPSPNYIDFTKQQNENLNRNSHPAVEFYRRLLTNKPEIIEFNPQQKHNHTDVKPYESTVFSQVLTSKSIKQLHKISKQLNHCHFVKIMSALFHLTLYRLNHYSSVLVRTIEGNRSLKGKTHYNIGYYATGSSSYTDIDYSMTFADVVENLAAHRKKLAKSTKNGIINEIPIDAVLNKLKLPQPQVEFNFMQGGFPLEFKNMQRNSNDSLQPDSITQYWYTKNVYEISLSFYVNYVKANTKTNTDEKVSIQITAAKRHYPSNFARDFFNAFNTTLDFFADNIDQPIKLLRFGTILKNYENMRNSEDFRHECFSTIRRQP